MSIDILPSSTVQTASKYQGVHALQGMEFEGDILAPTATQRLLFILAQAGQLKAELDRVYNDSYQQNLKDTNAKSEAIRYNNYWQAAVHLGTAAGAVIAGAMATRAGVDASSAVTIVTKGGDGCTTWMRGTEQSLSNQLRILEHKTTRGAEGGKRLADWVGQLQQAVRSYLDHLHQQNKPH